MSSPKVSVYSLSDLKNTTDDALPNYLTSLKFKQSHTLADTRLFLGYSAVAIAGVTFYADYKLGWDATKFWTLWAVIAYFILNGALTYWIWGVEKGTIFMGQFNGSSISVASSVTKNKPVYSLQVQCTRAGDNPQTLKLSAPFTRWFDSDGYFVAYPFQRWLATVVPLVGEADPQKVEAGRAATEPQMVIETQQANGPNQPTKGAADGAPSPAARSRKPKRTP
ncbi:MAG: hypothetical protein LQ346_006603 [Caloplaca aetnensis]|nr:MAG: hypothetical protein LQ346_006603 [Caloplaca aetnensis]